MRVAVVGGSLAGVTTALLLSDLGHLADALDGVASTGVDAALASWQVVALERGRAFLERTRDMGRRLQGRSGQWWPDDPANRFGLGQATVEAQL